jgi:hypothetical protein
MKLLATIKTFLLKKSIRYCVCVLATFTSLAYALGGFYDIYLKPQYLSRGGWMWSEPLSYFLFAIWPFILVGCAIIFWHFRKE